MYFIICGIIFFHVQLVGNSFLLLSYHIGAINEQFGQIKHHNLAKQMMQFDKIHMNKTVCFRSFWIHIFNSIFRSIFHIPYAWLRWIFSTTQQASFGKNFLMQNWHMVTLDIKKKKTKTNKPSKLMPSKLNFKFQHQLAIVWPKDCKHVHFS